MARKKKLPKQIEYEPSEYQKDIFNEIINGDGNIVIEASAGSGKSYTLIKSIGLVDDEKRVLVTAFNKSIVDELKKKIEGSSNVDCKTLHSLGLGMVIRYIGKAPINNIFKYNTFVKDNILDLSKTYKSLKYKDKREFLNNVAKYIEYGRQYLCEDESDLDLIEDRYNISTIGDEKSVSISAMNWGRGYLEEVDFTDMVWLPNILEMDYPKYDYIFVDECQDLNMAEREMMLKCRNEKSRIVSVGDRNQCVYSFAGADPQSFDKLKSLPNTKTLPLSISYRCPKNVVEFAKRLVPTIEYNKGCLDGSIIYNVKVDDIKDGDMVLCRNNAPLIKMYTLLLQMGKKCYIKGKEFGSSLPKIVKSYDKEQLNVDCRRDGLFARMYLDLFQTRNKIMDRNGLDSDSAMETSEVQTKLDVIKTLETLSEGINKTSELLDKISTIFPKKSKEDGIQLCTIHKAKGLEANNVYIVSKSLMPSKSAKKDWEIRQEYNLMYVAYTRSKNVLGFIDEKDFSEYDTSSQAAKSTLSRIEDSVERVTFTKTKKNKPKLSSAEIVKNAEKIDFIGKSKIISINEKIGLKPFSSTIKRKRKW